MENGTPQKTIGTTGTGTLNQLNQLRLKDVWETPWQYDNIKIKKMNGNIPFI